MTRTDVHRPSALDPADYVWVAYTQEPTTDAPRPITDGDMDAVAAAPRTNFIHPGGCDVCGQRGLVHRYYYRHVPTGDVIVLGWDCAERMAFDTRAAYQARKRADAERERERTAQARREYEEAHPEVAAFVQAAREGELRIGWSAQDFLTSLASKLVRYGYLTERQTEAVQKIMDRHADDQARRDAERAELEPIPQEMDGQRVELTGEVLATKYRDHAYGTTLKMLVRDDRGFKVWGTVPETIEGLEYTDPVKGRRIAFTGKVEISQDDPTFGFFSRPTKARLVEDAEPVAA